MSTIASRIPLTTFAIAFGLTGLAEVWSTATLHLGAPGILAEAFWFAALVALVWLIAAHARAGARSPQRLIDQLRHPVQGPIAAIVPVIVMLLGTHLATINALAGTAVVVIAIAAGSLFAGWMLSHWLRGNATMQAVHGGFLIPTVALGFVGSYAAAAVHLTGLAVAYFAIGGFFWITMVTIVLARHLTDAALPEALMPTLTILLAPPVVAGLTWFMINGSQVDGPALAIAGLAGLIILMQLTLVPSFLSLPFTIGFWSFTFPVAAAVVYVVEWLAILAPPVWQLGAWVLVAAVTAFVATIAVRSVRLALPQRNAVAEVLASK